MNKLAMRRTWFQVHKWIGLLLAILIIPISVTGAALVWHDALDELVNPQRFATSGDDLLSPQAYLDAAKARLAPGERVAQISLPDDHGGPIIVAAARAPADKPQAGPPSRTMLYLDPPTARVLDVADSRAGLVRVLHVLHGSLMVPGMGRQIVGWIGVFMMVSCVTGLWLWWPTVGRWARGLRWKRHRNTDTNLHYLTGFWVALPLFVLSLTGAWISFPAFFGGLVGEGPRGPQRGPDRAALMRARPLDAPATLLMEALGRAAPLGRGELRSVTWPTDLKPDWTIAFAGTGRPIGVSVADDSGTAALAPPRQQGGVARLMRRIHDGTDMGIVWQVVIFLGGLLPAILGVTGIIMWWRARGWKGDLAARQRAQRDVVAAE
ncbi:PepSY domain-containing protein [Sphingomonas sp. SUN019]|uniref:PepSY-associated TM helix domain-containing protein n=1 Tax=Sphingomonas sp. SUN019 TaxID=2937788 RepID=UPI0021649B44|nr:PepSY-associated TM helix domain-containing protein [Sphingomonas sp. SUN019]UVO49647.1 PepSY domain-containing protein [Sphingomonas sp. SUN019]